MKYPGKRGLLQRLFSSFHKVPPACGNQAFSNLVGTIIVLYEWILLILIMQIERTNDEILIRVSAGTDLIGLQRILDYAKFREIASKSKATQKQIDELARESKSSWWENNKSRFIK